jgi:zinc transport system permease protein
MGIVLLISLLTIPVTIVNTFTKSFRTLAPAAAAVAVAGNLAGLALSYNFEVSPGAAIIFTLTVTLILVKLLTLLVKKRRRADENHL